MVRTSIATNILTTEIMSAASDAETLPARDVASDAETLPARNAAAHDADAYTSASDVEDDGDGGVAARPALAAAAPALGAAAAPALGGGPPPPPPPVPPPADALALLPSPHRPNGEVVVIAQESWLDWTKNFRSPECKTSRAAARRMVDRFDQAVTFADKLELMVSTAMNNPPLWQLVREEMQLDQKRKARQEQRKRTHEREKERDEQFRARWRARAEQLQLDRMARIIERSSDAQ